MTPFGVFTHLNVTAGHYRCHETLNLKEGNHYVPYKSPTVSMDTTKPVRFAPMSSIKDVGTSRGNHKVQGKWKERECGDRKKTEECINSESGHTPTLGWD